jgi:uncharacterized protein (DUF1501 family)
MPQFLPPFRKNLLATRRDVLTIGSLTTLGLTLTNWLSAKCETASGQESKQPKHKSCILIWLDGGPSHLETFDPKPEAPREVQGPFGTVATSVPGISLSELMPQTAKHMRDVAIVRSVTSPLGEHNFGTHYMLTGYRPTPVLDYPSYGAVVSRQRQAGQVLPAHIAVPNFRVGGANFTGHGYLPKATAPFPVGDDPARPDFQVRDLDFAPGLDAVRMNRRQTFLAQLNAWDQSLQSAPAQATSDEFAQAFRLVNSPQARRAFDLKEEPPKTRQQYGPRTIGQSCLLARRLIERGVPFVTVNNPGWDTHSDLVARLKDGYTGAKIPVGLIPSLDTALGALLEDLKMRGLLDETLVLVMGEFGRTPKLNTSAGRDHWPRVFSVLLAGAGIPGGQIIGKSDKVAESPADRPVTPTDLAATIYRLLGIDPELVFHTADGRPVRLNEDGEPITELLG